MIKGFYYKLVVLALITTGALFLVAAVAVMPSYFFSSVKNNIINTKLENQKEDPVSTSDQQLLDVTKSLSYKLGIIERAEKNEFSVSRNVIDAILLKKMSDIKITNIFYDNDPVKGKIISIQGNAPSREVLLSFRQALEDDKSFKQVDLPISNFVKGSNIKFSLSLILI